MKFLTETLPSRAPLALLVTAGLLAGLSGCGDDDPKPAVTANSLTLEFQHNAPGNTTPLRLNTTYRTAAGHDYRLARLWYYVSNVKLLRADGTAWAEPTSYHLLKVAGAPADNPVIMLDSVPLGEFTQLEFSVGVDPAANSRGDHHGDLSQTEGMYWGWAGGYKFWVMEGDYVAGGAVVAPFQYHIGTDTLYRTVRLPLLEAATVTASIAPAAHLFVDVNVFFNTLDLTVTAQRNVMNGSSFAPPLADRLATLFRVEHVHNNPK